MYLPAIDFVTICRLGSVGRGLRSIGRQPDLWARACRAVFSLPGCIPADELLRQYNWSWRQMFQCRCRLRTDGMYYITTTKILRSTQEGRGMKEKDKDLYSPAGLWVTSYRLLRFFADGRMFSAFCASQTPSEVRRAAGTVTPARPASLSKVFRDGYWGSYRLHEPQLEPGDEPQPTTITAHVLVKSDAYPNMQPETVRYGFHVAFTTPSACNCAIRLTTHAIDHSGREDELERLPIKESETAFIPFYGDVTPVVRPAAPVWDKIGKSLY